MVSYTSTESTLRHNKEKEEYTMRRMYKKKYPRREGEALWRYNKRISKKMQQDAMEIIIGAVMAAIIMAFMYVCLMHGGDGQCTFVPSDNGPKAYTCLQHGDNCAEND
jgi:hypothetical protein